MSVLLDAVPLGEEYCKGDPGLVSEADQLSGDPTSLVISSGHGLFTGCVRLSSD